MKKDSYGTFNFIDRFLTPIATKTWTTHRFSQEWALFILLASVFGGLASVVSVYSSYHYFKQFVYAFAENEIFVSALTILILIGIESLIIKGLIKFYKFALKKKPEKFVMPLIITSILYGFSFIMSTNGLALRESDKVSKIEYITDNLDTEIENLKIIESENIEYFRNAISTIKANPQGWNGGKKTSLTSQQLADIKDYNKAILNEKAEIKATIQQLDSAAKQDKKNNLKEVTATSDKYFLFMSLVMLSQMLTSGFVIYSFMVTSKENAPEDYTQSKITDISTLLDDQLNVLFSKKIKSLENGFKIALKSHESIKNPFEISAEKNEEKEDFIDAEIMNKNEVQKPVKVSGFFAQKTEHKKNKESSTRVDSSAQNLEYLKKHKKLVKTLKKYSPEKLPNSLIKKIKKETTNPFNGETTIVKVFTACQSVGFENINERGGVEL